MDKALEKKNKPDIIVNKILLRELEKRPALTGYIKFNFLTGGIVGYEANHCQKVKQS